MNKYVASETKQKKLLKHKNKYKLGFGKINKYNVASETKKTNKK